VASKIDGVDKKTAHHQERAAAPDVFTSALMKVHDSLLTAIKEKPGQQREGGSGE